jgi:hypothetical protein
MRPRTDSETKAINLSPAAQAALDHRLRDVNLTDAERHEVGRRVVLEAEARVRNDAKRIARDKAAELTPEEEKQLAEAQAAYDTAAERCLQLRLAAMKAERAAVEAGPVGATPEPAHLALRAAETRLGEAEQDVTHAAGRLARVQGQLDARQAWSRRRHVARHGF